MTGMTTSGDGAGSLEAFAAARRDGIGLAQYGPFDPATDTRDLVREAREELADLIVYLGFLGQKHGPAGGAARERARYGAQIAWDALASMERDVARREGGASC